jgi:hypothetical protein
MVIKKKGIAVLDGASVVHKLTNKNEAELGAEGKTVQLKGDVFSGIDAAGQVDVKTKLEEIAQDTAANTSVRREYLDAGGNFDQTIAAMDGLREAEMASVEAWYGNAFTAMSASVEDGKTSVQAQIDDLASFNTSRKAQLQSDIATEKATMEAAAQSMITSLAGLQTEVDTAKTNNINNIDAIKELEDYAATMQSDNQTALTTLVGDFHTRLATESAATVQSGLDWAAINQTHSADRAASVQSLQTAWSQEVIDRQAAHLTTQNNFDADVQTKLGEYSTANATLSGELATQTAARIAGDTAKSGSLATQAANMQTELVALGSAFTSESGQMTNTKTNLLSDLTAATNNRTSKLAVLDASATTIKGDAISDLNDFKNDAIGDYDQHELDYEAADTILSSSIATEAAASAIADGSAQTAIDVTLATDMSDSIAAMTAGNTSVDSLESGKQSTAQAEVAAQAARLATVQEEADTDTFREVLSQVSTLDSDQATDLSNAVATAVAELATEKAAQEAGDIQKTGDLNTSTVPNRQTKISDMGTIISDRETAFAADESAYQASTAAEQVSEESAIDTWKASTLDVDLAAATADRISDDTAINSDVDTLISARQTAITNASGTIASGDATVSSAIDAIEALYSGTTMTLSGIANFNGNVGVSNEVKIGVHSSVPAAFSTGDQSVNSGEMFYLSGSDDANRTGFEKGNKWYFCEDGQWFPSPFSYGEVDLTALFAALDAGMNWYNTADYSAAGQDVVAGNLLQAINQEIQAAGQGISAVTAAYAAHSGEDPAAVDEMMTDLEDVMKGGLGSQTPAPQAPSSIEVPAGGSSSGLPSFTVQLMVENGYPEETVFTVDGVDAFAGAVPVEGAPNTFAIYIDSAAPQTWVLEDGYGDGQFSIYFPGGFSLQQTGATVSTHTVSVDASGNISVDGTPTGDIAS